jgi:hypothetical protein
VGTVGMASVDQSEVGHAYDLRMPSTKRGNTGLIFGPVFPRGSARGALGVNCARSPIYRPALFPEIAVPRIPSEMPLIGIEMGRT